MWFVSDMGSFLQELTRVTQKVIFVCVPNRTGMGFLSQKYISGADLRGELKEKYIVARNIINSMVSLGWTMVARGYIDAPPWPDIGMKKEDFLKKSGSAADHNGLLQWKGSGVPRKNAPALLVRTDGSQICQGHLGPSSLYVV
jgi:hypothetical protein